MSFDCPIRLRSGSNLNRERGERYFRHLILHGIPDVSFADASSAA
jgi:hypothetical protein